MKFQKGNLPVFGKRLLAYLVDSFLVVFVAIILTVILSLIMQLTESASSVIMYVIFAAYYVYMFGKYGQTIGYKILKLKIQKEDGSLIDYKVSLYRLVATTLSSLILMIGHFMILFNEKGQALQYKLTNIVVVDVE
jgi:uncharacterized RDD family membrane protein YckC